MGHPQGGPCSRNPGFVSCKQSAPSHALGDDSLLKSSLLGDPHLLHEGGLGQLAPPSHSPTTQPCSSVLLGTGVVVVGRTKGF